MAQNRIFDSCFVIPNMLALSGPLETLYHLYSQSSQELVLIKKALQFSQRPGQEFSADNLVLMYLNSHGQEYINVLVSKLENHLGQLFECLREIRSSRKYLPSSVKPLGKVLGQYQLSNQRVTTLLINAWIIPALCKQYPERVELFEQLGESKNYSYYHRLIRRFLGQSTVAHSSEQTLQKIQRTDSCIGNYMLRSSSSSPREESYESTNLDLTSDIDSDAVFSKECCSESHEHIQTITTWIAEHASELSAWWVTKDGKYVKVNELKRNSTKLKKANSQLMQDISNVLFPISRSQPSLNLRPIRTLQSSKSMPNVSTSLFRSSKFIPLE